VFEDVCRGQAGLAEFRRIPYDDAIRLYGTDKPDLRNPIEMQDVTEHFAGSGFKVFAGMIEDDIRTLCGPSRPRLAAAARSATA
jgi:aspartyl-tRNA synthetase